MTSAVIDNRSVHLATHIRNLLPQSVRVKFAVGYFFLSGLEAIEDRLDEVEELRLLIGSTSNRETIEQLTEAYKRLEIVEQEQNKTRYASGAAQRAERAATAGSLADTVSLMDQTDAGERLVGSLIRLVEEGRLKVRVYTKGRLHAKAYIFDYRAPNPDSHGIAIVGSSNLTLAGIQSNTELNVIVHDEANPLVPESGNHAALTRWFNELWDEAQDFDALLMDELRRSWAAGLATPWDVYMKTLYTLVQDRLDGEGRAVLLTEDEIFRDLADFQRVAVEQAIRMIRQVGGCFVADVVGLGKSFIGAAIVKYFERAEGTRALIICPKPLEDMWIGYNERYQLNAQIVPISMLRENDHGVDLLNDPRYKDRNFVLIDESHNFRHTDNQRYRVLQEYIQLGGRRACLLTATPRNSRVRDVYNQMRLYSDDRTDLPIDPPNLGQYFAKIERSETRPGSDNIAQLQDVLRHVLIRRTRRHILRWYGHAGDTGAPLASMPEHAVWPYLSGERRAWVRVGGREQFFPRRELETLRYSIEETYDGLYDAVRGYMGKPRGSRRSAKPGEELTYARYGLWNYVKPSRQNDERYTNLHRAGINLRGLIRTMLFKRFESSVEAFRATLRRMIQSQSAFLLALAGGIIPAGEEAERLLGRDNDFEDEDDLIDALKAVTGEYRAEDFNAEQLYAHIEADIALLKKMLARVEPITPDRDDKLQTLRRRLTEAPLSGNKVLIFTQYADTAKYLYENLNPDDRDPEIEIIFGTNKSKARIVGRFAPRANPEFQRRTGESEIRLLVSTDVLAEGLNLQDGSIVVNYDLHWNPVRLIQRFGRIDRIGSEHDRIWGFNFLPERGIEKTLGIQRVLANRIQEIHDTIGEDAAILDKTEKLNEEAMYAIYENKTGQLSLFEEAEDQTIDLSEAEEIMRRLRAEDPDEFRRVTELRDGIRSARATGRSQTYVFCQAGEYQRLYLVDRDGQVITTDIARILAAIRAEPNTAVMPRLPHGHNERVMAVKRAFGEEVKSRAAGQTAPSHTRAQSYVLRQLRQLYSETDDEERRARIQLLERGFQLTPTAALRRSINFAHREQMTGDRLMNELTNTFHDHRLQDRLDRNEHPEDRIEVPRIVCSLALV